MESAVLSTPSNSRFRSHLKNAASAIWTRTLPKQHRSEAVAASSAGRPHTYPRVTQAKRAAIAFRVDDVPAELPKPAIDPSEHTAHHDIHDVEMATMPNGTVKLTGTLAREVANAWSCRIGQPDQPAPSDRVQSLFNDIELYPTKTQVFEMLVCARQCARRKSLTLTFGEFCVFAAELRRCSRQAKQSPKVDSPLWNSPETEAICKHFNGSEASPPPCEVFLGGSCNPTTWRSDIAIPMLKKMGITYFNPQVEDWSTELMEVEHRAKAAARALLFVLDRETRAVAASVEVAHLAAAPRDLLLVLRPYARHQMIARETISDHEYVELSRARATLQEAVERRGLPAFTDIPTALRCARAVLRGARTHPRHLLGHTILRLKRAYDAAGGRTSRLPRSKAADVLRDVTRAPRDVAERCLPPADTVDFETFCAAVAELAGGDESPAEGAAGGGGGGGGGGVAGRLRRAVRTLRDRLLPASACEYPRTGAGADSESRAAGAEAGAGGESTASPNGLNTYNARLRACGRKLGLFIPKNGGNRSDTDSTATGSGERSADSVFTPGTERRLDALPAMLGAPAYDVYLGGAFPSNAPRPAEVLRAAGVSCVVPRVNDYSRMFSAPARRAAPAHPESPRRDKKPRPEDPESPRWDKKPRPEDPESPRRDKKPRPEEPESPRRNMRPRAEEEDVELRDREQVVEPSERLSASDFYQVTEDVTPQPFKGTYDEDLLLGCKVLLFSMSAEAPSFATMVLAAHYMGLRPGATVLIVQPLDPASMQLQYSEAAVKDFNRGRHYLTDLARRTDVPVFDNTEDALACVVSRLRSRAPVTSSSDGQL